MKALALCTTFLCIAAVAVAQDIVLKHQHYTTYYNPHLKVADSVSWDLSASMIGCGRSDPSSHFKADPRLNDGPKPTDYATSGYDRGHLFSHEDAVCNGIDNLECFYMTNMLPQPHSVNAGKWKTLERHERVLAGTSTIHVIAGGIGSKGNLPAGENIPSNLFKAILVNGKYYVWIMPNDETANQYDLSHWESDVKTLNYRTGLKLH